jgi:hypothetical protein
MSLSLFPSLSGVSSGDLVQAGLPFRLVAFWGGLELWVEGAGAPLYALDSTAVITC